MTYSLGARLSLYTCANHEQKQSAQKNAQSKIRYCPEHMFVR